MTLQENSTAGAREWLVIVRSAKDGVERECASPTLSAEALREPQQKRVLVFVDGNLGQV